MRGQARRLKAPLDANFKARPSRTGWVPPASLYVQCLNGTYFHHLKWCWEIDERVIAPEAAWDEAAGESAPDP
eukprot:3167996-Rhodomonas_salina.1